jgi:hypothetical protein
MDTSNTLSIVTNASETIDGINRGSGGAALEVSSQYNEVSVISDGHNWISMGVTFGIVSHEKGGLETDISDFEGLVKISGGATSALTITSAGENLLDDTDIVSQRTTLGLGSIVTQDYTSVNIDGGAIDGTTIGVSNPQSGTFSDLTTSGSTNIEGASITLGKDGTAAPGQIIFHDNQNADNFTTIIQSADAVSANVTFTLPSADGTANQVLKTDGSGNLSWLDVFDDSRQVIAGDGLTGGGDLTADRTLSVGDGDGITVSAGSISVNVDDSTIEISGDAIQLKNAGITDAKINDVAASKITGTLPHENGGLEADISTYEGLLKISGGTTSSITIDTPGENLLDDTSVAAQRTTLGLGSIATQDYTSVNIDGGAIDGTTIGAITPSDASFNSLTATGFDLNGFMEISDCIYFGDQSSTGTWRLVIDSDHFEFQRYNGTSWDVKFEITD